jgi:peptide/nickel transport system ATP-binding protein
VIPRPSSGPLLTATGVWRTFRLPKRSVLDEPRVIHALRGVSLSVHHGQTVAVVGESGSGKTTLMRILMALDFPTKGTIHYRGTTIESFRDARASGMRQGVQIVFQDPMSSLDPRMKVNALLREPLRSLDVQGDHTGLIRDVLDAVRLPTGSATKYPHEFSGGQRQRIAIARALITRPQILIADEPVSALDLSVQAQILNLLIDLQDEYEIAIVLVSHDLGVVRHFADRVAVMYQGRIVEEGLSTDVFENPQHPYTNMLLDSVLTLDGQLPAAPEQRLQVSTASGSGCAFAPRCPLVHARCTSESPALEETPVADHHLVACFAADLHRTL